MKRIIVAITLLLVACVAAAHDPHPGTQREVIAAADYTDGVVFPCPNPNRNYYEVCVATAGTGWDVSQIRKWATYGLGHWDLIQGWQFEENVWSYGLSHWDRREVMVIFVTRDGSAVMYVVGPL